MSMLDEFGIGGAWWVGPYLVLISLTLFTISIFGWYHSANSLLELAQHIITGHPFLRYWRGAK